MSQKQMVRRGVVIPMGSVGYQMALRFKEQIQNRHTVTQIPNIEFLSLINDSPMRIDRLDLPAISTQVNVNDDARQIVKMLHPDTPWAQELPNLRDMLEESPRVMGQVSLCQQADLIIHELDNARKRLLDNKNIETLSTLNMSMEQDEKIHVFLLLSLADAFMSGYLPDLPYLIQHVWAVNRDRQQTAIVHLVLALPGFDGEIAVVEHASIAATVQKRIYQRTMATLMEIDYLFGLLDRPRHYQREFGTDIKIKTKQSPLRGGRIFLLQDTNDRNHRLSGVGELADMVGTWLYDMMMTPLGDHLESMSGDCLYSYSSFGHGSLVIPFEQWRERNSAKLSVSLLQRVVTGGSSYDEQAVIKDRRLGASEAEMREYLLTEATAYVDQENNQPQQISGMKRALAKYNDVQMRTGRHAHTFAKAKDTVNGYQQEYTEQVGQLRGVQRALRHTGWQLTKRHTENSMVDSMYEAVLDILDAPLGGLRQASAFLEARSDQMAQQGKNLDARYETSLQELAGIGRIARELALTPSELKQKMDSRADRATIAAQLNMPETKLREIYSNAHQHDKRIAKQRHEYVAGAETAAGVAGVPYSYLVGLLLLTMPALFLFRQYLMTRSPLQFVSGNSIAILYTLILLTLSTVLITRNSIRLRDMRRKLANTYDRRLKGFRDTILWDVIAKLYRELDEWVARTRDELTQIWGDLNKLRAEEQARFDDVGSISLLCDEHGDRLVSSSLLTQGLIIRLEDQTALSELETLYAKFRRDVGTPKTWYAEKTPLVEIKERLERFTGRESQRALSKYTLLHIWNRTQPDIRQARFRRLYALSSPYLQGDFGEDAKHKLAKPDQNIDTRGLIDQPLTSVPEELQNPYEMILSSVLHGFPLRYIHLLTEQIASRYDELLDETYVDEHYLQHTMQSRIPLPDPTHAQAEITIDGIPTNQLYAVARALKVLELEADGVAYVSRPTSLRRSQPLKAYLTIMRDGLLQSQLRKDVQNTWNLEVEDNHNDYKMPISWINEWIQQVDDRERWAIMAANDFVAAIVDPQMMYSR